MEPVRRGSEPDGRASELAGRASDPAGNGRASELARRAFELPRWVSQPAGRVLVSSEPWTFWKGLGVSREGLGASWEPGRLEKENGERSLVCGGTIGHRPLRGRCLKSSKGRRRDGEKEDEKVKI